ncbi:MAG: universal stress protein [Halobacteriales archaeon]|nr:universal stress protein [Halobacteriales archaeon]
MTEKAKILVPVRVLEGDAVAQGVVELLSSAEVLVVGYHVLPEQTAPGQAREQFEEQARKTLDEIAESFKEAGADAETLLVFTHDEEESLERVSAENDCDARLIRGAVAEVDSVLVPLRGEVDVEAITAFVTGLLAGRDVDVTLYATAGNEDEMETARERVSSAGEVLRESGVETVTEKVEESSKPVVSIAAAAADHDTIIMGERAPSLGTWILGDDSERVAEKFHGPVLVVERREVEGDEAA